MNNIPLINESDEVIGKTTISEARAKGYMRRISRVFVFNEVGNKILLQKRSVNMDSYPLRWDQSAAGHVDLNETYQNAAKREMKEELGIVGKLLELGTGVRRPGTFEGVYRTTISEQTEIHFDTVEVEEVKWVYVDWLEDEFIKNSEHYCPGFMEIWNLFRDKLIVD